MKRIVNIFVAILFVTTAIFAVFPNKADAAFNRNLLIDDVVFGDSSSMSIPQVDAFLNARNSCISLNSGFSAPAPTGYSPSTGFQYGGNVSAGNVIVRAAQAYDLNPQVLLTTLQKEQSLLTSTSCSTNTIAKAVGYGCPDSGGSYSYGGLNLYTRSGVTYTAVSGTCVNSASKAGFSQQIIRAAWMLKFSQQRSLGNVGWAIVRGSWNNSDDLNSCYSGLMTQGTFKRCPNSTPVYFDGWATIDNTATHMDSGATAALYRYTPHFHGNQNFVSLFESYFGSTISSLYYSCRGGVNLTGAAAGRQVVPNRMSGARTGLSLIAMNNTGSKCMEVHNWANGSYNSWNLNLATNHPAFDPANGEVISADVDGDGRDELIFVKYRATASGKIEIHTWDQTYQHWRGNVATNHPAVDPATSRVIAADVNGDRRDELVLVRYTGTASGKIEIHTWLPGQQKWLSNVATNHPSVSPTNAEVIASDINGDLIDELLFIKYRNNGSGKIEVHTWLPNRQGWVSNIATNHPAVDPANDRVISADINGDNIEELQFVKYRLTSSGKIEVHTWLPNRQGWVSNIATNYPSLP